MASSSNITIVGPRIIQVERLREEYPFILHKLLNDSKPYVKDGRPPPSKLTYCFEKACEMAVRKIEKLARKIKDKENFLVNYISTTLLSDLFKEDRELYARMVVMAVLETETGNDKHAATGIISDGDSDDSNVGENEDYKRDPIGIHKVRGGTIQQSFFVKGVVIKKTPSCITRSENVLQNPKILLLDINLDDPQLDNTRFLDECTKSGATLIFVSSAVDDQTTKALKEKNIVCISSIARDDMDRIAFATDGYVLNSYDYCLEQLMGSCEAFEEVQFQNEAFNIFRGCDPDLNIGTIVLFDADKFTKTEEEVLRHEIEFVRSVLKNPTVVNGKTIYMKISSYLKNRAKKFGGNSKNYIKIFANALEYASKELHDNAADATEFLEPAVLKIDAVNDATSYAVSLVEFVNCEVV